MYLDYEDLPGQTVTVVVRDGNGEVAETKRGVVDRIETPMGGPVPIYVHVIGVGRIPLDDVLPDDDLPLN